MNFIDYLKDLLNRTNSGEPNTASIEEQIREIQTEGVLPDAPKVEKNDSYERLNYDAPTDEEIEQTARQKTEAERRLSESALETEIEALRKQYEADKATGSESYDAVRAAIDEAYGKAASSTENDLLKRGLARSSAAANRMGEIEDGRASSAAAAASEYGRLMNKLDGEIAALETKRQKAFADFDVTYTLKLTEQIQALKAEREAKQAEALKYNNTLSEKEYNESIDRQRLESDLYTEALAQRKDEQSVFEKQSETAINAQYQQIYNLLYNQLSQMSAADAQEAVRNNPLYSDYLNKSFYYKLYNEFGR